MKKVVLISLCLLKSVCILLSQNNAIVIKHIGEQDKSIRPLVIANYNIEPDFSDKYLKYSEGFKSGPKYGIDTVLVMREVFVDIDSNFRLAIDTNEEKRILRYGSFLITWILNDEIVRQVELNDRNKSLQKFYKLSSIVKAINFFDGKYELLKAIDGKICRMYFQDEDCNPPPNNIK